MRYAYQTKTEGLNNTTFYVTLIFDRVLVRGQYYRGHQGVPIEVRAFLDEVADTQGVCGDFVRVSGSELQVKVCPFYIKNTVKRVARKVRCIFAPFEGVMRVPLKMLQDEAAALNIEKELTAAEVMTMAAELLPNQDPIRLAAAIKDLGLPAVEALTILAKLAPYFQGENGDPIRLVAAFKSILALV